MKPVKPEDILRPADYEFYNVVQKWEPHNKPRSAEQLTHDTNKAHDNIKVLVLERDRLQEALALMNKRLNREVFWRNFLLTSLILSWTSWISVAWWLAKVVSPLVIRGMQK